MKAESCLHSNLADVRSAIEEIMKAFIYTSRCASICAFPITFWARRRDLSARALRTVVSAGVFFLCAGICFGQSCTSAKCSAASCSQTDVMAALPSSSNTNATVTVTIPSCPSGIAWSSADSYSPPSAVKSLIVQGQTTCTGSGDPADNNLSCTDGTVIKDSLSGSSGSALTWSLASGQSLRVTGITIQPGSRSNVDHGTMVFACADSPGQLRIDHNHFTGIETMLTTQDCFGVMDHNEIQEPNPSANWLHVWNPIYNKGASGGNGDGSWAAPTDFGTGKFLIIEQNTMSNGVDDCTFGGRAVARFNTFSNGGWLQTHPTGGGDYNERGCRAYEIYGNSFTANNSSPAFTAFWMSSGTALFWGNTSSGGYKYGVNLHSMRRDSSTYSQQSTPNGWGYCGTSFDGIGSAWDQNTSAATGYACLDQPGRGQGDLITGTTPNAVNSKTGRISWPDEALEPIYEWNDTWTVASGSGGSFMGNANTDVFTNNRDYYLWCNASSHTGCSAAFDGSNGTGSGTLASRPSTCTKGVAYWATDQGNWNQSGNGAGQGELFVCTATNTWSLYYTPYTYPAPLNSQSATVNHPAPVTINGQVSPQ
jgi:hypothetical protein